MWKELNFLFVVAKQKQEQNHIFQSKIYTTVVLIFFFFILLIVSIV